MGPASSGRATAAITLTLFGLLVARVAAADDSHKLQDIQLLLASYCNDCHTGDTAEAEVDLAQFKSVEQLREQPKTWIRVLEMLTSEQMPPKDADQPTDVERAKLTTWVRNFLKAEAAAHAGDPGPVVLRRLTTDEYNYTLRDITGVATLNPTKEFPVDGAAGEGFTNVGSGQGMSPALVQKYLDAGKHVAEHVVLTPTGIRFSPYTTERDQTDALMAEIQAFYRRYSEDGGGSAVNLQGIRFDTNQGGRLPLSRYLAATLEERESIASGKKTLEEVAAARSLSPKYLQLLWETLNAEPPANRSPLLAEIQSAWQNATPADTGKLLAQVEARQAQLWKFNSVGHIGMQNGPKQWQQPISNIITKVDVRQAIPANNSNTASDVATVYLAAKPFGKQDGGTLVLQSPRIEFPGETGREPILLKDLRSLVASQPGHLAGDLERVTTYLSLVSQLNDGKSIDELSTAGKVDAAILKSWAETLDLIDGERTPVAVNGQFTNKLTSSANSDIRGWGSDATPSLLTNRSEKPVNITTLTIPARGVTVHPSPTLEAFMAWQCPEAGEFEITAKVADADDKCGNGAAWRLEHISLSGRRTLAEGNFDNGRSGEVALEKPLPLAKGDVLMLSINARDQSHVCDTTAIEFQAKQTSGDAPRTWNLAHDIVDNIHNANPLPDSFGNAGVWHFGSATNRGEASPVAANKAVIPAGSSLAQWRQALAEKRPTEELKALANKVQAVLTTDDLAKLAKADLALRQHLLGGPEPTSFKTDGESSNLTWQLPADVEMRLPQSLVGGGTLVATATASADCGGLQMQIAGAPIDAGSLNAAPILIHESKQAELEKSLADFRSLFPQALCYARIVPVDEVVTLKVFYREDDQLQRLMLTDAEIAELNRLWEEFFFVAKEPLKLYVSWEQLSEFATQDNPEGAKALAPLKQPMLDGVAAFRKRQVELEPLQLQSVIEYAAKFWRRPLSATEKESLEDLYRQLRKQEIEHEAAIRLLVARVLTSPAMLYKLEEPAAAKTEAISQPVTDLELASRLSYFLWSSSPDNELRELAEANKLSSDEALISQTQRMLKDERTRRLAIHFACQWLHVRDFDKNNDKNEKLYPEFASLREDMNEETVRFFTDLFQNDGSILATLTADHTYLSRQLAKHYGIDGVNGQGWQRVEGVQKQGRGGVLGMATVLATNSGASRTSPILRGNWVYETLLGEHLPRPPATVPQLPEELPSGLTARQLIERHSSDAACAKCHKRIDPYGFALEQYDTIGRLREAKADTKATLLGGNSIDGIEGLRNYLAVERRDDFVKQFCRKLLGFALGREVQLSDEPLLEEMQTQLKANDYRFSVAVEAIVLSPQFRNIRTTAYNTSE